MLALALMIGCSQLLMYLPLVDRTIVQFGEYAQNNNVDGLRGYQQLDIHVYDVLRTLMFVEFATLNLQSVSVWFCVRKDMEVNRSFRLQCLRSILIGLLCQLQLRRTGWGRQYRLAHLDTKHRFAYGRIITAIEEYDAENMAIYFDGEPC